MGAGNPKMADKVLTSTGCWLGNVQQPLIPTDTFSVDEIIKKSPFMQVRVKKTVEGKKDEPQKCLLYLDLDSDHNQTASMNIFRQSDSKELVTVSSLPQDRPNFKPPLALLKNGENTPQPEPEPEETEEDKENERIRQNVSRYFQFSMDGLKVGESMIFIVYLVNTAPVEGKFALSTRVVGASADLTVLVPRQFKIDYFEAAELSLLTECDGEWKGFTEYGGAPTDMSNYDWLIYNQSYLIKATEITKCMITLVRTDPEPIDDDLSVGLIVLYNYANKPMGKMEEIEREVLAHSLFPLPPGQRTASIRCVLVPPSANSANPYRFQIIAVPSKKKHKA
jgi:hypothetical protein